MILTSSYLNPILATTLVAGILVLAGILVNNSMNNNIDDLWKYIETQPLPDWFDSSLLPLLNKKIAEKKNYNVNKLNYMYAFASQNGRLGDASWKHVEDLSRLACARIPEGERFDLVVGIKSGGALVANFIASLLGRLPVQYIKISKYGKALTNIDRMKVYFQPAKKNTAELSEIPDKHHFEGKRILIVDDQTATGHTLEKAKAALMANGAQSVKSLCLTSLMNPSKADYYGFDGFVLCWAWGIDS